MNTTKLILALLIVFFGFNTNANAIDNTPTNRSELETILIITGYGGATSVGIGQQLEIDAFFIPANEAQGVTWTIENTSGEATLEPGAPEEAYCTITGVSAGTVTITATAEDGILTASLEITIVDSGSDVWVNAIIVQSEGEVTTIPTGSTLQMLALISPENATDQSITWSVENLTGTATISATGLLTAGNEGVVKVIATANDPSQTVGFMEITIAQPTAIDDLDIDNYINLFPNPATKVLKVSLRNSDAMTISLIDITGKVVKEFNLKSNTQSIDVSDLKRGLYVVKIQLENSNKSMHKKLLLN